MKLKKFISSIMIVFLLFTISANHFAYATLEESHSSGQQELPIMRVANEGEEEQSWVQKAFSEAYAFLNETEVEDDLGIFGNLLVQFRNIVRGINVVLLVLLAGLSTIALAIVGIRYIMAGNSPENREAAKKGLHTVFTGMIYGFGAYAIWTMSIGIVTLIIGAFAQG